MATSALTIKQVIVIFRPTYPRYFRQETRNTSIYFGLSFYLDLLRFEENIFEFCLHLPHFSY